MIHPTTGSDRGATRTADERSTLSVLKPDDIALAKEWAANGHVHWQDGDGWRSVSCRLAHEVERLNASATDSTALRNAVGEALAAWDWHNVQHPDYCKGPPVSLDAAMAKLSTLHEGK